MKTILYATIRQSGDGHRFVDMEGISADPHYAKQKAVQSASTIPQWVEANPIVDVVALAPDPVEGIRRCLEGSEWVILLAARARVCEPSGGVYHRNEYREDKTHPAGILSRAIDRIALPFAVKDVVAA